MLFHQKIIAILEASDNVNSIMWSNIYDHGEIDLKDIKELANTFYTWQNIKNPSDFTDFILDNPHYGILVHDTRHRLRTIHAIKHIDNNIFNGITLNPILSHPIEFEVKPSALKHTTPLNTTDNPSANRTLRSSPSTTTLHDTHEEDTVAIGNPNLTSWKECEDSIQLATKGNSIMIIHPLILSILLKTNHPITPNSIEHYFIQSFTNILAKLDPNEDNHRTIESLFLTFTTTLSFMNTDKTSRVQIEFPINPTHGFDYITQFIPKEADFQLANTSNAIPTETELDPTELEEDPTNTQPNTTSKCALCIFIHRITRHKHTSTKYLNIRQIVSKPGTSGKGAFLTFLLFVVLFT